MGRPPVAEHLRFARKVLPTAEGCHYWLGAVADDGYGRFTACVDGGGWVTVRAHRWAYEYATGRRVPAGRVVEHRVCDEPLCTRFEHLRESTQADNVAAAVARGRTRNAHLLGTADIRGPAARSRALRAALLDVLARAEQIGLDGWEAAVVAAVASVDAAGDPRPGQMALW